ncbi:MAG: hypothetical protein LC118_06225 [Dehalococcoidia bacterium]|nr:hypothetical protein [Dehalococcoidia bacterium]
MHHKKRKPPAARSACKLCKPWKLNGAAKTKNWNLTKRGRIDRVELREMKHGEGTG